MGQMHLQRAVMLDKPPKTIVVSDMSDERLSRIQTRFGKLMAERGVELILVNVETANAADYGPYDDIVNMVPSPGLIAETVPHLAENGVYNIFAGVAKGVTAELDLGTILAKNQRLVGTSGSSIADLRHTLHLWSNPTRFPPMPASRPLAAWMPSGTAWPPSKRASSPARRSSSR